MEQNWLLMFLLIFCSWSNLCLRWQFTD